MRALTNIFAIYRRVSKVNVAATVYARCDPAKTNFLSMRLRPRSSCVAVPWVFRWSLPIGPTLYFFDRGWSKAANAERFATTGRWLAVFAGPVHGLGARAIRLGEGGCLCTRLIDQCCASASQRSGARDVEKVPPWEFRHKR